MRKHQSTPRIAASLALFAALLLAPRPGDAQGLPRDPAERAKVIAQILETNASQLTLFDRGGKEVGRIGTWALYDRPVLSPDGKRVVVIKA